MEPTKNLMEPLLERAEIYSKTSFELLKLKTLEKTADVSASLASRTLFTLVVSFFAFTLNIAIGLWLGDLFGKAYYGFLIVAFCYALVALILYFIHPIIKARVNNVVIKQLYK